MVDHSVEGAGSGPTSKQPQNSENPGDGNEETAAVEENVLARFAKDDTYQQFVEGEVDSTAFASWVMKSGDITYCLNKLDRGVFLLDKELREKVVDRYEDLLLQLHQIQDVEGLLGNVRSGVESLKRAVKKIRSEVSHPYVLMESRVEQLSRLQETSEMLRYVLRFLYLTRRLRGQLEGGARELPKAAQSLRDLETLLSEADLRGIEAVDNEVEWIRESGRSVSSRAGTMLDESVKSLNQTEMGSALQVFFNLGKLPDAVHGATKKCLKQFTDRVRAALDSKSLNNETKGVGGPGGLGAAGRSSGPASGASAQWKATLWSRIEKTANNDMLELYNQVWTLQRVLVKKRDPVSHVCFIDDVLRAGPGGTGKEKEKEKEGEVDPMGLTDAFWKALVTALVDQLRKAFDGSTFIHQAVISDFPRLRAVLLGALSKMQQQVWSGVPANERVVGADEKQKQVLLEGILPLEADFLKLAHQRLFNPVTVMFEAANAQPTSADIKTLERALSAEITNVMGDEHLLMAVTKRVVQAVQLFKIKIESALPPGGNTLDINQLSSGAATPEQKRNISLANNLIQLHRGIAAFDFPASCMELLRTAVDDLLVLYEQSVDGFALSLQAFFDKLIVNVHKEDFGGSEKPPRPLGSASEMAGCSIFMNEMVLHVKRINNEMLSKYLENPVLKKKKEALATRMVRYYVANVALIRPLREGGKFMLGSDIAAMEACVSNIYPVRDLGEAYRQLRSLRAVIFLTNDQVEKEPHLYWDDLPPSVVVHHLFSRAPQELLLPHSRMGMPIEKYLQLVEEVDEEALWSSKVAESLDWYTQLLTNKGEKTFPEAFTLIKSLGPRLLEHWKAQRATLAGGQ